MTFSVPIVLTSQGRVNTPPATLLADLVGLVSNGIPGAVNLNVVDADTGQVYLNIPAANVGYTAGLPGSLIADVSGTDVAAMAIIDQAVTDLINSVTPWGANEVLLNQLGQIYGVPPGQNTNTSVNVIFSGTVGYIIPPGFAVSDGVYTYYVVTGGVINSGGTSGSVGLFCVASQSGSWAVPANTVTSIATSVPTGYTLTCNNLLAGTPSVGAQTTADYQAQVINAGKVESTGVITMLQTLLSNVPGVQSRLVTVLQSSTNYKVIVGGGDIYQVGYAIYIALGLSVSLLVGSSTTARNVNVSIIDGSDTVNIEYIAPPLQNVSISLTWNTSATNIVVSAASVSQLAAPALAAYVNSVQVGQSMNLFALQESFVSSISSILPANLVNRMVFSVYINGTLTAPTTGTGAITGDPESYFFTTAPAITITQG